MITLTPLDPKSLAETALICLLLQKPMTLILEPNYQRNGLPLPMKKVLPADDGTTSQNYRPMDILEYVQEVLSGEMAKRRSRDKRAEQGLPEAVETDQYS